MRMRQSDLETKHGTFVTAITLIISDMRTLTSQIMIMVILLIKSLQYRFITDNFYFRR